ncbi:MAG TPA: transglutaminase domain-containing protein, partial [Pirellulales bacterium]|nr:transglutaminase domain-containing protein [Pirellulales bacterium]
FGLQSEQRIRMTANRDQLMRQEDYNDRELQITIGTTGIIDNVQRTILPCWKKERDLLQMPEHDESQPDSLAGLRDVAARVLRESGISPLNRLAASRALNNYLGSSGTFVYSLTRPPGDGSLDPLEDFVTRHPVGHCEYFAGALVMMLRSQGIPARMAIGFKGGEWNSLGNYYQVQQLHAHAWVEVYLDRDDIPADALLPGEHPPGAWLVLDPTEGTVPETQNARGFGLLTLWSQYLDYTRVLWGNYILGWNNRRQENSLYEPLANTARQLVTAVVSPQAWQARWHAIGNSRLGAFWEWYRRHWFSWRGGLVAAGFSLVVIALVWAARRLIGFLEWLGLLRPRRADDASPVLEIYRRLETALATRGLRRHPAQTAYEFASLAGAELAESIDHRRVAHLPRHIVEAFYRVRFGGHALDNLEADGVEHALAELELALAERCTAEPHPRR